MRPVLWYRAPAEKWVEALPVGNGRLGAMVFGGVQEERWQLNEDTLWTGGPEEADNPAALPALSEIRRLLFAGAYEEAQRRTDEKLIRKPSPRGEFGSYTTLGELVFRSDEGPSACIGCSEYRRELDLSRATVSSEFTLQDTVYSRQTFASAPDQVLVILLSVLGPAKLSGTLTLRRPQAATVAVGSDALQLSGRLQQRDEFDGMRYLAHVKVTCSGGRARATDAGIHIEQAERVLILVAAGTDYRKENFRADVLERIEGASAFGFTELHRRHVAEYQPWFERVGLELGKTANSELPTDARLLQLARGESDPDLFALYFQLGRYLSISSSRPHTMAANLQGIWAEGLVNPWSSDYHTNINVQMNYWLAETANLPECVEPLIELIQRMRLPGRQTARVHYGARGWVVHTVHNAWGFTAPGEDPLWGLFPMAAPWLCQHLWEHYAFGGDREYLRRVWPCLEEAAEFCLDWLVPDPKTGKLVSGPANSPENSFRAPGGGTCSISMGPSMDQQILWDHFSNVLDAAEVLGIENDCVGQVREARERLLGPQVGADGRLLEWAEELEELEPQHRHVSHLFGLHPGRQITPRATPELCEAARKTLEARGDAGTGWSRAWKICFWARLHDGDRALKLLGELLRPVALRDSEFAAEGAGSYPNLFCAHPPFQIDGNFGATAGVAELLLQSHEGVLTLLPALPKAWAEGRVTGLRARGAFVLEIEWVQGELSRARVHSLRGTACELWYRSNSLQLFTKAGETYDITAQLTLVRPS